MAQVLLTKQIYWITAGSSSSSSICTTGACSSSPPPACCAGAAVAMTISSQCSPAYKDSSGPSSATDTNTTDCPSSEPQEIRRILGWPLLPLSSCLVPT